jgi:hypothetical protein
MDYCRRSISLAALNESSDSGSLNGGVLLNVSRHAWNKIMWQRL